MKDFFVGDVVIHLGRTYTITSCPDQESIVIDDYQGNYKTVSASELSLGTPVEPQGSEPSSSKKGKGK